ncbi:Ubiquitin-activating enzyme E1-like [Neolecta irregularis DAH-3]|uniref:Ubiquitin-activating enzyme E1-like n=1 Tax=Neolecta irregularis (strain DAH-3) TaxID=1198029 RepID=A0A1U7LGB2_NEOID|nr:Ubiquitin-activating enzyme E1-like [Neolecta irregularis DAH-3]|eukprot:OLL21694.1 Ubiquitin-activating enzyme E1-like [Neolecta irregularis DAH-3]
MSRDKHVQIALPNIYDKIKSSKVLMVGAGGIGCELLKNLVLTGFGEIHIVCHLELSALISPQQVDLDTIDLSNLNRQFLFQKQHVRKPKALVAKDAAGSFNPNVKLEAYHANIKDPTFHFQWFQSFDIVFNGLDNLDARRHVNKMCLAANVPLIESGTTGFLGQVQAIVKDRTECYDCTPKQTPINFPVCTIRSTPSQPIHCIVWAKSYLFVQLFGVDKDEINDMDYYENVDNTEELGNLKREADALKNMKSAVGRPEFGQVVFDKVFGEDICRLQSMSDMWKSRKPPVALNFADMKKNAGQQMIDSAAICSNDQNIWTLEENCAMFVDSLQRLSDRLKKEQSTRQETGVAPILNFDKDDADTLDFVAATANIRSHIFGIEKKSKFEIKQMAGNIIPAIATTNAIIAGVCVLQAFKIMQNKLHESKMVFLSRRPEHVFNTERLQLPNPHCDVCAVTRCAFEVDIFRLKIGKFVESVLRQLLEYEEELSLMTDKLIYDFDFDDNASKTFAEMGINDGAFLTVIDDAEDEDHIKRVNLVLLITHKIFEPSHIPYNLPLLPTVKARVLKTEPQKDISSDETAVLDSSSSHKRKFVQSSEPLSKKRKVSETSHLNGYAAYATKLLVDKDIIVIEDENRDTITID